jgi:NitT/TauT family transport system substrate-binding protein
MWHRTTPRLLKTGRRHVRRGVLPAAVVAASLALAACSSAGSSATSATSPAAGSSTAALTNVGLVLDWTWQPYHVAFMYGIANGIYKAHGINLTLTQGQGSSTTATLVGTGKYQFGFADTSTAVLTQSKGVPIKNVLVIQQSSAFATECWKSADVSSPAQLKGHSVIMIPSESTAQIWPAYLAVNHLSASSIPIVSASVSDKVTLFVAHKADCMAGLLGEDTLEASLQNSGIGAPMPWAADGIKLFGYSIITSDSVINSDPSLVKEFVAATIDSWRATCGNQGAAVALFAKEHPELSSTAAEKAYNTANLSTTCSQLQPPAGVTTTALGASSAAQWDSTIATLRKYAGLTSSQPASDYYTNAFIPSS